MRTAAFALLALVAACGDKGPPKAPKAAKVDGHERMLALLRDVQRQTADTNPWLGDRNVRELRPVVAAINEANLTTRDWDSLFNLAIAELWLGNERAAIKHFARAQRLAEFLSIPAERRERFEFRFGVAYLRLAETENCCARNTPESCILPLSGGALHTRPEGARGAIRQFTALAKTAKNPLRRLGALWLLNLAYMTVGEWPDKVPAEFRLSDRVFASEDKDFPRFENIAGQSGFNVFTLSGGVIADDFDNDGHLDVMVSTWDTSKGLRYYRNNRDGTFTDRTEEAGLSGQLGGLNLIQADYDNDGHLDVYVMRGAWLEDDGQHPNSLLRNTGGGKFVDVTFDAGLGERHYPCQTAGWQDYDNDGDLDLFVGNETSQHLRAPCQLFRNNGDGTFTDVARSAGVTNFRYTKSVAWGDYNGDGHPDLYVSNLQDPNRFYRNNGDGTFTDVGPSLGMTTPVRSFPCWFWDYDNDGKLDLYVSAYEADVWDLARYCIDGSTQVPLAHLWKGDGKGGFRDVAKSANLVRPNAPMGANYGDLDNDGYPDFYLGTGYPPLHTVMPNVMYRNRGGKSFLDVTLAGGFGHLQKGHGVVFADLDNDGDQDVFEQMGGALKGDAYYDVLYENPGFKNHWIAIKLVGTASNRSAIGARIKIEAGGRTIYKHVNSGGSFGGNPLRQSIGIGKAKKIDRIEIYWPKTRETQVFTGVPIDSFITITEGESEFTKQALKRYRLGG